MNARECRERSIHDRVVSRLRVAQIGRIFGERFFD